MEILKKKGGRRKMRKTIEESKFKYLTSEDEELVVSEKNFWMSRRLEVEKAYQLKRIADLLTHAISLLNGRGGFHK